MNRRTIIRATTALAVVATVATGCTRSDDHPAAPSAVCSDPVTSTVWGTINSCDAAAVITTAVRVVFSYNPVIDASPQAGAVRALPLMTGDLATANARGPQGDGALNPGADFLAQRAAGWAVSATVTAAREDGHTIYLVHQTLTPAPGHTPRPGPAGRAGATVSDLSVTAQTTRVATGGYRLSALQVR